jgi:hypothetical protein
MAVNIFDNDAFSSFSLTAAINKAPYVPKFLRDMNLFSSEPIDTVVAAVEELNGQLSLVSDAARGSMENAEVGDRRKIRDIRVPHLPEFSTVMAEDVQGKREFGTLDTLETVMTKVNRKMVKMRRNIEATHEYHRIGAVQGQIRDSDGVTVLRDFFTIFGVSETDLPFDFTAAYVAGSATDYKVFCNSVTRNMSTLLGATPFTRILAICGDDYFDNVTAHESVRLGYERWMESQFFRESQLGPEYNADMNGFPFGNITFVNYRGSIGGVDFFPADEARFIPLGVPDLFQAVISPGPQEGSVNTMGVPFYASQEPLQHGMGRSLYVNSNILFVPTRPAALIKSTGTV